MVSKKKAKKIVRSTRSADELESAGDNEVQKLTTTSKLMAEIDGMSSDEEGEDAGGIGLKDSEHDGEEDDRNAEALALRQAIKEGVFDKLAKLTPATGPINSKEKDDLKDEDESSNSDNDEEGVEENEDEDDEDEEEEEEEQDDDNNRMTFAPNYKALRMITEELEATKDRLPWPEQYTVTPAQMLPFHGDKAKRLEIHDDLKREVAFYDLALESVQLAKEQCKDHGIPFTRPNDFFAEMIKTDEHMAKVKDRLIFESKKIAAVEQRRNNKQHKSRAKEIQQQKLLEKNQRKKEHFQKLSEWTKNAAQNRRGGSSSRTMVGGREDDEAILSRFENSGGKSAKRKAADRKYGHGKKSRLDRKPDSKSLNDMSGFNKQVYDRKMKKGSSPAKRPGKRARDAARSRKK